MPRTWLGACGQVGSLGPAIEVWDLDVLDAVEPVATLGGEVGASAASAAAGDADDAAHGTEEDAAARRKTKKKKKEAQMRRAATSLVEIASRA